MILFNLHEKGEIIWCFAEYSLDTVVTAVLFQMLKDFLFLLFGITITLQYNELELIIFLLVENCL